VSGERADARCGRRSSRRSCEGTRAAVRSGTGKNRSHHGQEVLVASRAPVTPTAARRKLKTTWSPISQPSVFGQLSAPRRHPRAHRRSESARTASHRRDVVAEWQDPTPPLDLDLVFDRFVQDQVPTSYLPAPAGELPSRFHQCIPLLIQSPRRRELNNSSKALSLDRQTCKMPWSGVRSPASATFRIGANSPRHVSATFRVGPVRSLADDDLGSAFCRSHLPVLFGRKMRARRRRPVERAGSRRSDIIGRVVRSLFELARQLRERNDRALEFTCQDLSDPAHLRYFNLPISARPRELINCK